MEPCKSCEYTANLDTLPEGINPKESTNAIKIKYDSSQVYTDYDREFKNICTSIVVDKFFGVADNLYEFMESIVTLFEEEIDKYEYNKKIPSGSIVFLYKGGNVLRIIEREFLKELPLIASDILDSYYSKDFKRSDADFSIYINPQITNFSQVVNDITALAFTLQSKLKAEFLSNPERYFEYFRYSDSYKRESLEPYFIQIRNSSSISDPKNLKYLGKKLVDLRLDDISVSNMSFEPKNIYDKLVAFDKTKSNLIVIPFKNTESFMYVTENRALEFVNNGKQIKFNLDRTKINFSLVFSDSEIINIGGELIDVSVPLDSGLHHFWENKNHNVSEYSLKYNDEVLKFKSYSLKYLIHDLEMILIGENMIPWDDNKYKKRLNRLFYLYMVKLFIDNISNNIRTKFFDLFKCVLQSIKIRKICNNTVTNLIHASSNFEYYNLVVKTLDLLENHACDHFYEYVDILIENCEIALQTLEALHTYSKSNGVVIENQIYDGDINYSLL
jgi:hypothetical protein